MQSENEMRVIRTISNSTDPVKAMEIAIDLLEQWIAPEEIKAMEDFK